jgi:hypothetical protein
MAFSTTHSQAILELEARHDELLALLTELENRVTSVLAQHQVVPAKPAALPLAQVAEPAAISAGPDVPIC